MPPPARRVPHMQSPLFVTVPLCSRGAERERGGQTVHAFNADVIGCNFKNGKTQSLELSFAHVHSTYVNSHTMLDSEESCLGPQRRAP